jgi:hypothetical protein
MTAFTPDSSKVERERLVMEFEEHAGSAGIRMDVDTYRALLVVLDYVGSKLSEIPTDSEVSDAWHYLIEWADA